jgi:antitoxin component of RelBE/YafQ-DinJ toxin-antitoxin module
MKRNNFIHFRVSDQEYHALNIIAQREGINPSEAMRMMLREDCSRRGLSIGLVEFYKDGLCEMQNADQPK